LDIFRDIVKHGQIIINLNDLTQLFAIFIAAISFIGSIIGFIGSIITIKGYYEAKKADKKENPPGVARRKSSLTKIKHILDISLRDIDVPIELDLWECGDEVIPPDKVPFPLPKPVTRQLPSSKKILKILEDLGGSFLILGDPGSGKTTLLLQLAKELLDRADSNEHLPIPAVFHLSSWADHELPLGEWLIDELNKGYGISRNFAEMCVKDDLILPLLDGLDEVAPEKRELCVEEINKIREQHGSISIVVCSRSKEYDELKTRLELPTAICVKLLSRKKIEDHLKSLGTSMDGVRVALEDDKILWELLKTPLMLNIVTQTFKGKSAESVRGAGTLEERRTQIFDAYKDAMFHRVGRMEDKSYTPQQTEHWLSWLAKSMKQRNQTVFYLEKLQPDWLPSLRQRKILVAVASLILGLILGLFMFMYVRYTFGQFTLELMSVVLALVISVTISKGNIDLLERLKFPSSPGFYFYLMIACILFFCFALLIPTLFGLDRSMYLLLAVCILLLVVLAENLFPSKLLANKNFQIDLFSDELNIRVRPNEGIYKTINNGLILSLVIALGYLPLNIIGRFLINKKDIFVPSIYVSMSMGVFTFVSLGFSPVIKHIILRALLKYNGFAPFGYEKFLDYASNLIFLRKVGGGYEFIHGMILDYFASLEPPG
jgi:GTPase SAR1 family protein